LQRTNSPQQGGALLFAYGTLMRGYPLHRVLARRSTLIARGTVRGALLDLGRYPGLVDGRGRVSGELYRLDRLNEVELLGTLDREEGYHFRRSRGLVTLARGRRVRAWLYRYRGLLPPRAVAIPQGDYRRVRWR